MSDKIQLRRDTSTNWTTVNPVLSIGEVGLETDTKPYKSKIGDGTSHWADLPYQPSGSGSGGVSEFIDLTDAPNSYINNGGKIVSVKSDLSGLEFIDLPSATNTVKVAKDGQGTQEDVSTILFPFSQSVDIESGTVAVNTSIVVKDENNTIVQNCNSLEVPSQSLISLSEDTNQDGNTIVDFKGIPTQKDDSSVVKHAYGYKFPDARVTGDDGGTIAIHTGVNPTISSPTQDFNEYSKILFMGNSFTVEPKAGETTTLQIENIGISVEEGNTEHPGIKLLNFNQDDFDLNFSQAGIVDIDLADKSHNGFMAYYNSREVIPGITTPELYRETILKPNFVSWEQQFISYDKNSGGFTIFLQESAPAPQLFKIVARATLRRQVRQADMDVWLYFVDSNTNEKLVDVNGETPEAHKTISAEIIDDYIELATMISIPAGTSSKSFRVVIKDDSPGKFVDIMDCIMGTSAIVIEKVNENNQTSNAMRDYEIMTQQSMRFIKHEFTPDYENANYLIQSTPIENQDYPADTTFAKDGWVVHYQDAGTFKQNIAPTGSDKCIEMNDGLVGNGYFNICRILDYEDTFLLRGNEVTASIDRVEQNGEFVIIPIVWKRRLNEYPVVIITGMNDQGVYNVTDGWEVVDGSKLIFVAPTPPETVATFSIKYTVPTDAVNVGFMVMPTKQQAHSLIKFTDFRIGCEPSFKKWVIEYPSQNGEELMHKDTKYIKFNDVGGTKYNTALWYQIPYDVATSQPLYIGEQQAGGSTDVIKIYQTGSSDFNELHNKGKLKFLKDGVVTIHTIANVGVDKIASDVDHATATFWYVKDNGDGLIANGTKIQASMHERKIPKSGNVWNDGVRTSATANWIFTMPVKANEVYWFAVNSAGVSLTSGDEGHIYAYPKGTIEITYVENALEISNLQTQIEDLNKLVKATTEAIANKAYLEIGWDSGNNKPTLEAKTETP